MSEIEYRTFNTSGITVRGAQSRRVQGYAAVWNRLSEELGGFREKISPGTFTRTLKGADIRALFNHDANLILGRTKSGTLRLQEDAKGLLADIELPDTALGHGLYESIRRGDVSQMSFAFRMVRDHWDIIDGDHIRTLIECELFDVSAVTMPAYPDTSIGVRLREPSRYPAWELELDRLRLDLAAVGL